MRALPCPACAPRCAATGLLLAAPAPAEGAAPSVAPPEGAPPPLMLRAPPPPDAQLEAPAGARTAAADAAAASPADGPDGAVGAGGVGGAGGWRCARCGCVLSDAAVDAPCRAPPTGGAWPGGGGAEWPLMLPDGLGLLEWEARLGEAVHNLMGTLMTPGASRAHPSLRRLDAMAAAAAAVLGGAHCVVSPAEGSNHRRAGPRLIGR